MTTSKAEEDIYRTYDLGVNSFITKPVTFEGLVAVMRTMGTYWIEIVELPDVGVDRVETLMNHGQSENSVVDDDEDDYFLTHAILVDVYGDQIDVEWISSYEAAIETLLGGRHGLCFLDYNLGARTGLESAPRGGGQRLPHADHHAHGQRRPRSGCQGDGGRGGRLPGQGAVRRPAPGAVDPLRDRFRSRTTPNAGRTPPQ